MPVGDPHSTLHPDWLWRCAPLALTACGGPQSTLDPAGTSAARIAALFWWMTGGTVAIWAAVVALALYAALRRGAPASIVSAKRLVVGGGVVFPVVVLTGVLTYGLAMLPPLLAPASEEGTVAIRVSGEQWWWRVRYLAADGAPIELANEIHLPVNEVVHFELDSPDVIHSFWIPALGGKTDMIPGRLTRLNLRATRPGRYRGACAEYCGTSHAYMTFAVVVETRAEFERWLARQGEPARAPSERTTREGQSLFIGNGCGACHTIRGTDADGTVGPDLTHVGGRLSLGAGRLAGADIASLRRWIAHTERLKPKVLMPSFGMLPPEEIRTLAAYLGSLE